MMFFPLWRAMACLAFSTLALALLATTISLLTWELSVSLLPCATLTAGKIVSTSVLYQLLEWMYRVPESTLAFSL